MNLSVDVLEKAFVNNTTSYIESFITNKKVSGVSLEPVFKGSDGKTYIVLGKESSDDKFNFFGGKVERETATTALFREIYEELGLFLNPDNFKKSHVATVYEAGGASIVFVCHIEGLDDSFFNKIMVDTRRTDSKYTEMTEIGSFDISSIDTSSSNITDYVKGHAIEQIRKKVPGLLTNNNKVSKTGFYNTTNVSSLP